MAEVEKTSVAEAALSARVRRKLELQEERRRRAWGHLLMELHALRGYVDEVVGMVHYSREVRILDRESYERIHREIVQIGDRILSLRRDFSRLEKREMDRQEEEHEQQKLDGWA